MRAKFVIQMRNESHSVRRELVRRPLRTTKRVLLSMVHGTARSPQGRDYPTTEQIANEIFQDMGFKSDFSASFNNVNDLNDAGLQAVIANIPEKSRPTDLARDIVFFGYTKMDHLPFLAVRDSEGAFTVRLSDDNVKKLISNTHHLLSAIRRSRGYRLRGMSIAESMVHVLEDANKTEILTGLIRKGVLSSLWKYNRYQMIFTVCLAMIAGVVCYLRWFVFNIGTVHSAAFDILDKTYSPILVACVTSIVGLFAHAIDRTREPIHWQFEKG